MTKKRYRYCGPATGIEIDGQEVMLYPGKILELAPEHRLTLGWLAHFYLKEEGE